MKLKLDDKGAAVLLDGKPVYVQDDGKEVAFDAAATVVTINRLNGEAKTNRERAETAEGKLKPYVDAGITDPVAAKKSLELTANIDAKKLVDAGEMQKVRDSIESTYKTQLSEKDVRIKSLEGSLYSEKIGGQFGQSKYITEKLDIPSDLVQAKFGSAFKLEDDKVVAYDATGNKIYSRARPGELANFDEAMEFLVEAYPNRDAIMKGSGHTGSNAPPAGGKPGAAKSMRRSQFDALPALQQQDYVLKQGGVVVDG